MRRKDIFIMEKKKTLQFYTRIFSNLHLLKGSGIISDSRLDQCIEYLEDRQWIPAELKSGKIIKDYLLHEPSGQMYHESAFGHSKHYVYDQLLCELLTQEEVDALNKDACEVYRIARDKELFNKAEKIKAADYSGWVYCDGFGEEFFPSVDDYFERHYEEFEDYCAYPVFLWACSPRKICALDLDSVLDGITEDAWDDFDYRTDLNGVKELEKAMKEFNALNESVVSYTPNFKLAVLL